MVLNMNKFLADKTDIAVSFGDGDDLVEFTGKDVFVTSFHIEESPHRFDIPPSTFGDVKLTPSLEPITLTLVMKVAPEKFVQIVNGNYVETKVSQKKVKDCNVQELLFAVRYKIKNKEEKK